MNAMTCQLEIPEVPGLEKDDLTVGREFIFSCEGPWPKFDQSENIKLILDEKQKYSLQLRGLEMRDPNKGELKLVSYVVGPNKIENLILAQGEQKIELGPIAFNVRSVIEKKSEEKIEPFGAIGPLKLAVPVLYWVILFGVLGAVVVMFFMRIRRRLQRQALLEKMREHDSALAPLQEFHQKLRRLHRENAFYHGHEAEEQTYRQVMSDIEHSLRVYLIRRFQVPALDWTDKLILRDLKKYHPEVYVDNIVELRKIFNELAQAKTSTKILSRDVIQVTEHSRRVVEAMEKSFHEATKRTAGGRK